MSMRRFTDCTKKEDLEKGNGIQLFSKAPPLRRRNRAAAGRYASSLINWRKEDVKKEDGFRRAPSFSGASAAATWCSCLLRCRFTDCVEKMGTAFNIKKNSLAPVAAWMHATCELSKSRTPQGGAAYACMRHMHACGLAAV